MTTMPIVVTDEVVRSETNNRRFAPQYDNTKESGMQRS